MYWMVSLYNLALGTAPEEYLRFERRVSARYTDYRAARGRHYLGLYAVDSRQRGTAAIPWQELPYAYAEVSVVDDEAPAAGAARAPLPPPPDIVQMTAAARAMGGGDSARIDLRPIVPSPFAYTPLVFADKLLRIYAECRTYISRERPRTALWLTPLVPSPIATQGLALARQGAPV